MSQGMRTRGGAAGAESGAVPPVARAWASSSRRFLVSSTMVSWSLGGAGLAGATGAVPAGRGSASPRTSMECLPTLTTSPGFNVARVTRWELTKVPFRLFMSSTTSLPASLKMRAWWLETARLSTCRALSGARPIPMGCAPTSTSLRTAASYFRINFAISRLLPLFSAQPAPRARQPPVGSCQHLHHDYRDVILSPVFIGQRDQAIGGLLGAQRSVQDAANVRVRDHAIEAVGTEHQSVARQDGVLFGVHLHVGINAQGADEDALHLAGIGLLLGQDAATHLLGDQGMVLRDLFQLALAHAIEAAVA